MGHGAVAWRRAGAGGIAKAVARCEVAIEIGAVGLGRGKGGIGAAAGGDGFAKERINDRVVGACIRVEHVVAVFGAAGHSILMVLRSAEQDAEAIGANHGAGKAVGRLLLLLVFSEVFHARVRVKGVVLSRFAGKCCREGCGIARNALSLEQVRNVGLKQGGLLAERQLDRRGVQFGKHELVVGGVGGRSLEYDAEMIEAGQACGWNAHDSRSGIQYA